MYVHCCGLYLEVCVAWYYFGKGGGVQVVMAAIVYNMTCT